MVQRLRDGDWWVARTEGACRGEDDLDGPAGTVKGRCMSSVRARDGGDDREPEAGPCARASRRGGGEAVEGVLREAVGESRAFVPDLDRDGSRLGGGGDGDGSPAVVDRVVDEVVERLSDAVAVAVQLQRRVDVD